MAALEGISPFARELSALCVEDDAVSRRAMAAQLKGVFKELILAPDGREGLAAFRDRRPQLVLTDNRMPFMSGIEMTAAIRRIDPRVPVIFITSAMDTALLVEALSLGIAAFVPKPAGPDNLHRAVATVVAMLENDHLQHKTLEQELTLLQFRDKYHEYQQGLAFRKELSLFENDFRHRSFQGPAARRGEWIAQVEYQPHDVMCGDSYSLRRFENGLLVLIADAMGKGLAASLTSSISAHAFNNSADLCVRGPLRFQDFVQQYTDLMRKRLLEDEVLPMTLAWLPTGSATLYTAGFGMPPLLVSAGGKVRKLRCENPPLSQYDGSFRTTIHELGGARSILLYTDGLNEAVTADGSLYRDHLDPDFLASAGLGQLLGAFRARVGAPGDDVTLLLLSRVDGIPLRHETLMVESRLEAVEQACQTLEHRLEGLATLESGPRGEFIMALREAALNAYEHGSLEISSARKHDLLEEGTYYQHLLELEPSVTRRIRIDLSVQAFAGQRLLKAAVTDEGPGFHPPGYLFQGTDSMLLSGRGLQMVRKYTDAFYLNEKGNAITLIRFYPGGSDAFGANELE